MKKFSRQIALGIIFTILGFMLTVQIRTMNKQTIPGSESKNSPEILIENEHLKKQREELKKQIDELTLKTKEYEEAAAGRNKESTVILEELQQSRLQVGTIDVKGPGIVIYITPKSNLFGGNIEVNPVNDFDLLAIVNELNAADAEAISINDIRLTSRSGIRNAGTKSIVINNERISPTERITIKAIGNKKLLEGAINFPGSIPERLQKICDVTYEMQDNIVINKSTANQKFEYAKEVENNDRGD